MVPLPPIRSGFGLVILLLTLTLTCHTQARTAVVETNDGRSLEGELVRESAESIVLNIAGIDATIPQDQVARISYRESDRDYFDQKRAELEDDDLDGRLKLVEEMMRRDAFGIAQTELAAMDRKFPDNPRVLEQRQLVEARQSLKSGGELNANRPSAGGNGEGGATPGRSGTTPPKADAYLTPEQMNRIKVYEVDLESDPRVSIPRDTLNQFLETYAGQDNVPAGRAEQQRFFRMSGVDQLRMLFDKQARDLYGQVDIQTLPAPLLEFRRDVNPRHVAGYLAPTFGNGKVPGFSVFSSRPQSDEEAFTNLYLLTRMKFDGVPMIDRGNPAQSLMLQWGLPRDQAQHPAPDVEGWRPAFRSADDPTYTRYRDWIDSLYGQDNPDYGIDYTAPGDGGDGGDSSGESTGSSSGGDGP